MWPVSRYCFQTIFKNSWNPISVHLKHLTVNLLSFLSFKQNEVDGCFSLKMESPIRDSLAEVC